MESKTKAIIGGVFILSVMLGGVAWESVDKDQTLYTCNSKDLISDCINGVKASGLRCYDDANNTRAYTYCPEGWLQTTAGDIMPKLQVKDSNQIRQGSYQCDVTRCDI